MSRYDVPNSAGGSGFRFVRLKVRHNSGTRTIYLNPEDVSRLIEWNDGTRIILRSELADSDGYTTVLDVPGPIDRVAARLTDGSAQS